MDTAKQPGISLQQVFLVEAVFRHRTDPLLNPQPSLPPSLGAALIEFGVSEPSATGRVAVTLRVSADPDDENARYDFDVRLAAIVDVISEDANMSLQHYALVHGGALLYPFVREAVANLTARGHHGPVWLNPANIQAMVQSGVDAAKQTASNAGEGSSKKTETRKRRQKSARKS
jgi:preprotein translocase subunit SecB